MSCNRVKQRREKGKGEMRGSENACWICGRSASKIEPNFMVNDIYLVECDTCGKYGIAMALHGLLTNLSRFNQHARISAYTRARTIRGMLPAVIVINRYEGFFTGSPQLTIEEILSTFPQTLSPFGSFTE